MRVAVATVHDSANIGSYLQALAMIKLIEAHGDEPYLVRTRSEFTAWGVFVGYNNAKTVRSVKSFLKFVLTCIKKPKQFIENEKKYITYKKDRRCFGKTYSIKEINKINPDILLLGSDEIWNSNQPAFQNPLFYGKGIKAVKKFGYAISVGNMNERNWIKFQNIPQYIKQLDNILPRDERTLNLLRNNGISSGPLICDPTLQLDMKLYMNEAHKAQLPEKPFIAIYTYAVSDNLKCVIQKFAQENGLITAAVSLSQPWCDVYINCSPLEFGAVLEKAAYVYTSTFHGTIFSTLYHKNFVSEGVSPKVREIQKLLGIETFGIDDDCGYDEFERILKMKRDYSKIDSRIDELRKRSFVLYESCIKGVCYGDMQEK